MDKKKVVTTNTFYPSVAKQPHEFRQDSLVRRNSLKNDFDSSISLLENMHRKDMKEIDKTRKELQKSMLGYMQVKDRSREQRGERLVEETVFVAKRPTSLDMRRIESDSQSEQREEQVGGSSCSRSSQSSQMFNTSDPKNRSASETFYREKSRERFGSLPSIHKSPTVRSDNKITDAFERKSNQSDIIHSVLAGPRTQTVRDKDDSGYSSSVLDENQSTGAGDSMEEPILDIAPFPAYETRDIFKHMQLNKEAAAQSMKQKPNDFLQKLYLQRLKQRRQLLASKSDSNLNAKKKPPPPIKKPPPPKELPKWLKEPRVDSPPPPPIKSTEKPNKVIQSFRYSYAIEDYFRKNSRRVSDASIITDFEEFEEVKNGWLVQPLGSKVLNISPRTIPSVSPHQRRVRARLRQAQLLELRQEARSLFRRRSTDSRCNSRESSHDPLTKSQVMESIPEEVTKAKVKKKEVRFPDSESELKSSSKTSVESQTHLPDIQVTSAQNNHVTPTSSEQRNQGTKSYLSLPPIPVE